MDILSYCYYLVHIYINKYNSLIPYIDTLQFLLNFFTILYKYSKVTYILEFSSKGP